MTGFTLDNRLAADTFPIARLGLCDLRLMNDRRWPWLILVPQRPDMAEIIDLTPLDQTVLTFETGIAAQALKSVTACEKINIGALGNIVRQLHIHVIARNSGDTGWPGPVWGYGTRETYARGDAEAFIGAFRKAL
ncbi:HIT domain-containing protein [Brucella sp. IR073]|uniref:HIT domain-containing protein n=1 Tax=unclassified Brucella TaxID=2632610 RepID=UPI003B97F15B